MPLYEYQCLSCEHRFERLQKFSDPPVSMCPVCGSDKVSQLLSAPSRAVQRFGMVCNRLRPLRRRGRIQVQQFPIRRIGQTEKSQRNPRSRKAKRPKLPNHLPPQAANEKNLQNCAGPGSVTRSLHRSHSHVRHAESLTDCEVQIRILRGPPAWKARRVPRCRLQECKPVRAVPERVAGGGRKVGSIVGGS